MRVLLSLLVGLVIGVIVGLLLGWVVAPTEYVNSPIPSLATRYQEDYTLMIAAGYAADGDLNGVVERLRKLNIDNVPEYIQQITERFITNSRDLNEVRLLVHLAEGVGRLTPLMDNFRDLNVGGSTP